MPYQQKLRVKLMKILQKLVCPISIPLILFHFHRYDRKRGSFHHLMNLVVLLFVCLC